MRTDGEVRQKLKQVVFRHLKKRLKNAFKQAPDTCLHNATLEPVDRHEEAPGIQACVFTTDGVPRGVVCDFRYDNGARARGCGLWEPRTDREAVKEEYNELLSSEDRGLVAAAYPDLAALMWVLDEDSPLGGGDPEAGLEPMGSPEDDPESEAGWDWGRWPWSKKVK